MLMLIDYECLDSLSFSFLIFCFFFSSLRLFPSSMPMLPQLFAFLSFFFVFFLSLLVYLLLAVLHYSSCYYPIAFLLPAVSLTCFRIFSCHPSLSLRSFALPCLTTIILSFLFSPENDELSVGRSVCCSFTPFFFLLLLLLLLLLLIRFFPRYTLLVI